MTAGSRHIRNITLTFSLILIPCLQSCSVIKQEKAAPKPEAQILNIKAPASIPKILEGHLKMGTPTNPNGQSYSVNSLYFTRNNLPWLPVMGEIHYSRLPNECWEDSILAMKAGGLDIIATYVFWIFHEEIQNQYNWQGDLDLRRFLELCHKHNMPVWLRIGPWCHGEARNGGFPDWLSKVCQPRTMDPAYFEQVRRWYTAVAGQIEGLYYKDGGPIIGVQFDNEFGHAGGRGGDPYILKCKEIALSLGMDLPYYSVTGWGGAWVPKDQVLPVQGSYVDPFWARGSNQLPPFKELLFSDLMSLIVDTNVASDIVTTRIQQERLRYDPSRYPYATAELGGGMHHKWPRRPILSPKDTEAMTLCRLGEGANVIGYYMYHGGSQPLGKTGRLVEGGMPLVSYDYQAPLGEFGKTNENYYHLKRLHFFIKDFSQDLAPTIPSLSENPPQADDPSMLRYALRSKGDKAYLFFNNYQRYLDMPDRQNVQFAVTLADKELIFPAEPVTIPSKSLGIFPINMPLADATVVYASAQPLMRWQDEDVTRMVMVRLSAIEAQLCITGIKKPLVKNSRVIKTSQGWLIIPQSKDILKLKTSSCKKIEILLISEQDSLNAWDVRLAGQRHLALCPIELWQTSDSFKLRTRNIDPFTLRFYPETDQILTCNGKDITAGTSEGVTTYSLPAVSFPTLAVSSQSVAELPKDDEDYPFRAEDALPKAWRIWLSDIDWDSVSDVFVRFNYIGDSARLYLNGLLVADNFWCKPQWEVAFKRWGKQLAESDAELILVISPWKKDQQVFVQKRPDVSENLTAELRAVEISAEKEMFLKVKN